MVIGAPIAVPPPVSCHVDDVPLPVTAAVAPIGERVARVRCHVASVCVSSMTRMSKRVGSAAMRPTNSVVLIVLIPKLGHTRRF